MSNNPEAFVQSNTTKDFEVANSLSLDSVGNGENVDQDRLDRIVQAQANDNARLVGVENNPLNITNEGQSVLESLEANRSNTQDSAETIALVSLAKKNAEFQKRLEFEQKVINSTMTQDEVDALSKKV